MPLFFLFACLLYPLYSLKKLSPFMCAVLLQVQFGFYEKTSDETFFIAFAGWSSGSERDQCCSETIVPANLPHMKESLPARPLRCLLFLNHLIILGMSNDLCIYL